MKEEVKPNQRKIQALNTRRNIFDKATTLFVEKSYEKVTIAQICKAAGISVGAFYHHFSSKESVLNEGYFWFDEELKESWSKKKPTFAQEKIEFLIEEQLKSICSLGYIYATQFFKNQLSNDNKYILNEDRIFYKLLFSSVLQGIEEKLFDANPQEITKRILRISRGTIYDWCLHEGSYNLVEEGLRDLTVALNYYIIK